jgi:hypothetical protein
MFSFLVVLCCLLGVASANRQTEEQLRVGGVDGAPDRERKLWLLDWLFGDDETDDNDEEDNGGGSGGIFGDLFDAEACGDATEEEDGCVTSFGQQGVWVCRTLHNPFTGTSSSHNVCANPNFVFADSDECGCCGGTCPSPCECSCDLNEEDDQAGVLVKGIFFTWCKDPKWALPDFMSCDDSCQTNDEEEEGQDTTTEAPTTNTEEEEDNVTTEDTLVEPDPITEIGSEERSSENNDTSVAMVAVLAAVGGVLFTILFLLVLLVFFRRRRSNNKQLLYGKEIHTTNNKSALGNKEDGATCVTVPEDVITVPEEVITTTSNGNKDGTWVTFPEGEEEE